jgi:pimeloyl-ACP methyl ester carboxylesterase
MATVDSGGVPIHYEVIASGAPFVLVHGFSSSFAHNWQQTGWVDFLVGAGFQVIGVDCRAHGSSGKPHDSAAYGGIQMPNDVIAVMDDLGLERADLMGYSMGGWLTLHLLARYPERWTSVVVGGAGLRVYQDRDVIAAALEADDPKSITHPVGRRFRAGAERIPGNDLKALAALQRADRRMADPAALAAVDVPTLVVVGDRDDVVEPARLAARTIPGATLEILPGEDHGSAVSAQAYKDAVGRFLQGRVKREVPSASDRR